MNRIAVKQFAILAKTLPSEDISLDTELSFQYATEIKQVACTATFTFKHNESVLLVISCTCEFQIHLDDWSLLPHKGNEIDIPTALLELLAVHTIGTSRGVLFCKTEGTPFNELMIPPINVKEMIDRQDK